MAVSPYAAGSRNLELTGVITTSAGQQITLTQADIASYSINDSPTSSGIVLGGTAAASFHLSIRNADKQYLPSQFDNAEVHMRLRLNGGAWSDFGVWYVDSSDAPEQSVLINLSGADALKSRFEAEYADDKSHYPTTLGSLLTAVTTAAGLRLESADFLNADQQIKSLPKWGEKITLRKIVGYIAACAGGFAHMTRDGKLQILEYTRRSTWQLTPSVYHTFSLTGGQAFEFRCLQVKLNDDEDYTRYIVPGWEGEDNATNTVQVEGNPLYTDAIARNIASALKLLPRLEAAQVRWGGDPAILPGDGVTITDLKGDTHYFAILSQSYNFDGGLSVSESCSLPSVTGTGESYSTGGNTFDANGNIRAERISGLDSSVITATRAHFESLTAGSVTTDSLLASIIEAITLKAKEIKASDISTDSLTAMTAEILNATIRKLNSGTISTDELMAGIADITAARIDQLTAESITTDRLAAALAEFSVITAGTAAFDKETVRHLIAAALQVEDAVGEKVMIKNLMVDYATMVSANVGNLVIRASDGNYYRLDVDASGNVTPVPAQVTDGEIERGVTAGGKTIIDTQIVASDLSATNIKGVYALINRIDASRIDVDTLTARQAFIEYLQTADISSNSSIRIALNSASTVWRSEEQPDEARVNDIWVVPSTGFIYQKLLTDSVPEGYAFDVTPQMILNYICPPGAERAVALSDGSLLAIYEGGNEIQFTLNDDGTITATAYSWARIKDSELTVAQLNAITALENSQDAQSQLSAMRRYMEFTDDGLKQFLPGKVYYTLIDEDGFDVRSTQKVDPIATMNAEDGVKAERLTVGQITCKATSGGGWVWQEV